MGDAARVFARASAGPRKIDDYSGARSINIDTSAPKGNDVRYIMRTILLIILVLLLLGLVPAWPYSQGWGYYPSGGVGIILLIVIILALTGRL